MIILELLISRFIRPVESAELPNVARVSKRLETPGLLHSFPTFSTQHSDHALRT
jgi:hypothetical protein